MIEKIEEIEEKVCEYFSVEMNAMLCTSRKNALARGYLWYILHCDYQLSISTICKRYNRTRRVVFALIAKIKYLSETQKEYKAIYQALKV